MGFVRRRGGGGGVGGEKDEIGWQEGLGRAVDVGGNVCEGSGIGTPFSFAVTGGEADNKPVEDGGVTRVEGRGMKVKEHGGSEGFLPLWHLLPTVDFLEYGGDMRGKATRRKQAGVVTTT